MHTLFVGRLKKTWWGFINFYIQIRDFKVRKNLEKRINGLWDLSFKLLKPTIYIFFIL